MESTKTDNNLFKKLSAQSNLQFDYEVNSVQQNRDGSDTQVYLVENLNESKKYEPIDYNTFWDSIEISIDDNRGNKSKKLKANCLKRLVSKKKRRLQNEFFDLDLSYITKRVIAMGYPSVKCESLLRNSLNDIKNFLMMYHKDVKIYNLCLEKDRIYDKERFPKYRLGLFPFSDHDPCPVKLMLDFCVDISLYFLKYPYGVAAIHCKAGKGRTGVMIICYLIFSGLCKNSDEAMAHYALMRTINKKGVTISSQIRYIKYFETFLSTNLTQPYYKMIPKIMKFYINPHTQNMIKNYMTDDSYFLTRNKFMLNYLKIGPFDSSKMLQVTVSSLVYKSIKFPQAKCYIKDETSNKFYYIMEFNSDFIVNFDISLDVRAFKVKFYLWVNLWYSTLELFSHYIYNNNLFLKENKINEFHQKQKDNLKIPLNHAPTFVEMKTLFFGYKNPEEQLNEKFDKKNFTIHRGNSRHLSMLVEENTTGRMVDFENEDIISHLPKIKIFDDTSDNIIELIEQLKNDPDLNKLVIGVNQIAKTRHVAMFNRNDLCIKLRSNELDKFSSAKKMDPDFSIMFNFKLVE